MVPSVTRPLRASLMADNRAAARSVAVAVVLLESAASAMPGAVSATPAPTRTPAVRAVAARVFFMIVPSVGAGFGAGVGDHVGRGSWARSGICLAARCEIPGLPLADAIGARGAGAAGGGTGPG